MVMNSFYIKEFLVQLQCHGHKNLSYQMNCAQK